MFDLLLKQINWDLVLKNPIPFGVVFLIGFGLGWISINRFLSNRMKLREEQVDDFKIKLNECKEQVNDYKKQIIEYKGRVVDYESQLNDYKEQLKGASPADVMSRMDDLTAVVAKLTSERRHISLEQRNSFAAAALAADKTTKVLVACNTIDPECEAFAKELVQLFRDSKFEASFKVMEKSEGLPSDIGVLLVLTNPDEPSSNANTMGTLLSAASVEYSMVRNDLSPKLPPDFILVGRPATNSGIKSPSLPTQPLP